MSTAPKNYSLHLIGLGGAGANIIETFLRSNEIYDLLRRTGVKVTCLAIDVADHDVFSLQRTYDSFKEDLKAKGIPADKITLTARSVKFPTPEVMFEFIEKYPKFLDHEKARVPEDYRPWLSSSMEIPPLSGGVGRRRALSKAIYGLNYYYLRLIDEYIERFKEQVSSSTIQPVIFIIFGVGGGSGSGMVVDFARHLRRKLGSGFPILGLGILPCVGDDPPAKGASAYASMNELELLLDKNKNAEVKNVYGQVYENPFTAFITMPLGPAFNNTGSLVDAKRLIDEAIIDVLINSLRFDLADLLNNIGANLELGDRWIHTITTLKISYPINEHISLIKMQLEKLDRLRQLRKDKLELYLGESKTEVGGLKKIVDLCFEELAQVYKRLLIQKGTFEEKIFKDMTREYIYEDRSIELNFNMQIKGMEEPIKGLLNEVTNPVLSIGLEAAEGTPEARIRGLILEIIENTKEISKTHSRYHDFAVRISEDMESSVASTQRLTIKQKILLSDVIDFVRLVDAYLIVFRKFIETKTLADRLSKEFSRMEKSEEVEYYLSTIQRIQNPELVVLSSIVSGLPQPTSIELKTVDSNLSNVRIMKRVLTDQLEKSKIGQESLVTQLKSVENEVKRIERELGRVRLGFLSMGKKRFLEQKLKEFEQQHRIILAKLQDAQTGTEGIQIKLKEYTSIEKKFDVNTDYRKFLSEAQNITNRYYDCLSQISKDRGYYDRVAEITDDERMKIMKRILEEDESALTRETILREILDRRHFKEYLVGTLRILRLPSALGLNSEFRTDHVWVTVVSPRGVWDQDLASELKTTLSGYIMGDASRCITIREVDSKDPWTLRFLVIATKSQLNNLEAYLEMKSLYERATRSERVLAHSFLLEQGVIATRNLIRELERPRRKGVSKLEEKEVTTSET